MDVRMKGGRGAAARPGGPIHEDQVGSDAGPIGEMRKIQDRLLPVLVQIAKRIGDNGTWRIGKLNGILYLPVVGSKTTSFSSAFAGMFASN